MAKNFYDTLGVSKSASADEIKRAFRKKAHEYHPDKGLGNEEKFKEINEAYQVLSEPAKRQQYDTYGEAYNQAGGAAGWQGGGGPFGGFDFGGSNGFGADFDLGDIFGDMFGGREERSGRRNRGIDLEMGIAASFEEAVFGAEKTVVLEKQDSCKTCGGSGAENGAKVITCPKCHGAGQIATMRRTIFGQIQSRSACDRCEGTGKVPEVACKTCGGSGIKRQEKTLQIKIPAGIGDGQRIRITGEGEMGYRGSNPGDLYLVVRVSGSREFSRDGFSLFKDVPVSFTQAVLGAKILVKTLDGDIELKIPAGTQPNTVFKIKGRGVPHLQKNGRGDLLITARVVIPGKLSKKEKEMLKEMADERGEVVEVDKGFWEKIRDSF